MPYSFRLSPFAFRLSPSTFRLPTSNSHLVRSNSWTYRYVLHRARRSIGMPMTPLTKKSAINLANLVGAARPTWDFQGIMAALHKIGHLDLIEASLAALNCAGDPEAKTPGAMTNPVYRSGWKPGGDPAYTAHRRSEAVAHRAALDQARIDHRNADPEGSHRGYLAAIQALQGEPE